MVRVSTYLNFMGNADEAFTFYKSVFGTDYEVPIVRFGDMPSSPDAPTLSDVEKNQMLHIELPILGGASSDGDGHVGVDGAPTADRQQHDHPPRS